VHLWTDPLRQVVEAGAGHRGPAEEENLPSGARHIGTSFWGRPRAARIIRRTIRSRGAGWRDFGTGAVGDMACHLANMPFMALKLGSPTTVSAENSEINPETYQQWATITYKFPSREGMPPVSWYGGKGSRTASETSRLRIYSTASSAPDNGILCIGDKGTLLPRMPREGVTAF